MLIDFSEKLKKTSLELFPEFYIIYNFQKYTIFKYIHLFKGLLNLLFFLLSQDPYLFEVNYKYFILYFNFKRFHK